MKITCTRRFQFCAGHRVMLHESKCRHLHGHNYIALLTAAAEDGELDDIGRIIDFSVLKERIGGWIDREWDHGFVLWRKDLPATQALSHFSGAEGIVQKLYFLDANPTAEVMARYLLEVVGPEVLGGTGVQLVKVELWETENCKATATL